MRWPAYIIILLFVILAIPFLRSGKRGQFITEAWFGLLLILGGISFLLGAHNHVVLLHGRFSGATLDRWQIRSLGLLLTGFGIAWIYGPVRRWFKKK
jgi:hypothetical protein